MALRLSTWIFSLFKLPKKWTREDQPAAKTSNSTHPDSEYLADLTETVVKQFTYATAQGSFGDVWKCRWSGQDDSCEVAVKCIRIDISDDRFREIVKKRLMDDFSKWKQLQHEHILPLCGIAHYFGPVPAIVSPWMDNGSLSTYLHKDYDNLTETQKFSLLADVAAGLQYLHSKGVPHADLTANNVLVDRNGRARITDYGLWTTYSDLNEISYITSNVRWAAPELFEVSDSDTDEVCRPKLESDIYSFGCIIYQVLSGQRPYFDIRSDHQVVVAILRGVKPKRPAMPTIADRHWDVVTQCWLEISQRPQISDVRDLMDRYKDAVC